MVHYKKLNTHTHTQTALLRMRNKKAVRHIEKNSKRTEVSPSLPVIHLMVKYSKDRYWQNGSKMICSNYKLSTKESV